MTKTGAAEVRGADLRVRALYGRPDRQVSPQRVNRLQLCKGLGALGDCHASRYSPRQLLLAATGTYDRLHLSENSLRETLLIDALNVRWESGSEIRIGSRVILRVMFSCEACSRLNAYKPGLMREVGVDRGLLTRVVRGGEIVCGDRVRLYKGVYPQFPAAWQERLCAVIAQLPRGSWITYLKLAELNGVHSSYCRVFPRVLGFAKFGSQNASTVGVRRTARGLLKPVTRSDTVAGGFWTGSQLFIDEFLH